MIVHACKEIYALAFAMVKEWIIWYAMVPSRNILPDSALAKEIPFNVLFVVLENDVSSSNKLLIPVSGMSFSSPSS